MVAGDLRSFGRGFTVLEKRLEEELTKEEQVLAEDLRAAERLLEKVGRRGVMGGGQEEAGTIGGRRQGEVGRRMEGKVKRGCSRLPVQEAGSDASMCVGPAVCTK